MIPVIICGGVGTKMWPESRTTMPKHFLPLIGGKSLFELNYVALRKKYSASEIYVSTNPVQAEIAKRIAPEIPESNYLVEPEKRGTGPAIGFVAAKLFKINPDEPFMIVQSDVLREPQDKFFEMIDVFDELARKADKWLTAGARPEYAIMGIDYIIPGEKVDNSKGMNVYKVDKWLWRSTKEVAEEYVTSGRAFTHANHYCWTPRKWLESYNRIKPEWGGPLYKMIEAMGTEDEDRVIKEQYALMPNEQTETWTQFAIDHALIVEMPFRWIDFGTWESVGKYEHEQGRGGREDSITIDAQNNFVRAPEGKVVAMIGVENLVVLDTPDGLLICPKSQTGRVGEVVEKLKEDYK
jgi:mannose-1-phosphate guanylyltransferase